MSCTTELLMASSISRPMARAGVLDAVMIPFCLGCLSLFLDKLNLYVLMNMVSPTALFGPLLLLMNGRDFLPEQIYHVELWTRVMTPSSYCGTESAD